MGSISIFIFVFVRAFFVDYRDARARACAKRASVVVWVLRDRFADRIERRCGTMVYAFIYQDVTW